MQSNYLLDNDIYGILRKYSNGEAIKKFHFSIREAKVIPDSDVKLRMTPYSVMEVLGITFDDTNT